ncbi:MAG: TetR/AcrR family transcriptional regulator [Ruminococcaceae bacterium]|nr:TetR/AcrR family transcriptional regulator [Oscillospiraceae bacterium]
MPKIIENLEMKLMEEAKKQLEQFGYGALTIRSVAQACGVGVGTVYNYFSSKDELLAAYLLGDWKDCIGTIDAVSSRAESPAPVVQCMFDQLLAYARRHQAVFGDETAAQGFAGSFSRYHGLLRAQLAAPLRKFCRDDFTAEFVAESVLTWSMAGKSFDDIFGMINKLF